MRYKELTLEQLEDMEVELLQKEEQKDGYYSQLINIYKEMHSKLISLARKDPLQYSDYLQYIKKRLIACYIKYGTYLKMKHVKDEASAISSLVKAITLDKHNPIAHYRLGFLLYKARDYVHALQYFQIAIDSQPFYQNREYVLNEQQLFHAHMYLTNSALYVANQSYQDMEKLEWRDSDQLPDYEISPIYAILSQNENYLLSHAIYQVTKNQVRTCSIETCNEIAEKPPENTLVLYFGDRETLCIFNGKEVVLSIDLADILRHMLLMCSKDRPGTRITFRHYFDSLGKDGEVVDATFRKRISRLRSKLDQIGTKDYIIQTRHLDETAYYFDENIPYMVLYRVDDVVANEYITLHSSN
ncbi:hypothetical protein [Peribacillus asahii]|uniref:hypothetical protein n=1 Tax=Peribacillus asahii TaxID=228899 RepID=UPI00207AA96E|nr:hypothetical protein [Peribacillus asahii]USK71244.1 hypothetical protein LIS76_05630 [Peribacillus asahii]